MPVCIHLCLLLPLSAILTRWPHYEIIFEEKTQVEILVGVVLCGLYEVVLAQVPIFEVVCVSSLISEMHLLGEPRRHSRSACRWVLITIVVCVNTKFLVLVHR